MELIILVVATAVLALTLNAIKDARDKRGGTGQWKEHGPRPTNERVAHVERSRDLYLQGVHAFLGGHREEAQRLWRESAGMGHLRAFTGLGIYEYAEGRPWGVTAHWMRAAEGGDTAAQILDDIKGDQAMHDLGHGHAAPPVSVMEFADAYLGAEGRRDLDSVHLVIGTALHYGYKDFANEWARTRDIRSSHSR